MGWLRPGWPKKNLIRENSILAGENRILVGQNSVQQSRCLKQPSGWAARRADETHQWVVHSGVEAQTELPKYDRNSEMRSARARGALTTQCTQSAPCSSRCSRYRACAPHPCGRASVKSKHREICYHTIFAYLSRAPFRARFPPPV